MKSNYDKLSQALSAWYTPDQIEKIWALLKKFDQAPKPSSSQAGGPAPKESGFKPPSFPDSCNNLFDREVDK
jgi:hypothetical protein